MTDELEVGCTTCAHEHLDLENPICFECGRHGIDNYEEKSCNNCKYNANWEWDEPCKECRNNFWEGDDEYKTHEFLWESPQCVPEPTKTVKPTETDNVNHPSHYTQGGIECIDAMTSAFGKEAVKHFCICNAFKYVWRSEHKNGIEDIDKAIWYLNKVKELSADE